MSVHQLGQWCLQVYQIGVLELSVPVVEPREAVQLSEQMVDVLRNII